MKEIDKFSLRINFILNELEEFMSFSINNNLSFIDNFQFLSYSLDSLGKHNFKYLSQEFGNNLLDLVRQKGF